MENIIKFNIQQMDNNNLLTICEDIIEATVVQNAELVAFTINQESESAYYILVSYIDHLLSLMLRDYDSERLCY